MNWEAWSTLAVLGVVIAFILLERLGDWPGYRKRARP